MAEDVIADKIERLRRITRIGVGVLAALGLFEFGIHSYGYDLPPI